MAIPIVRQIERSKVIALLSLLLLGNTGAGAAERVTESALDAESKQPSVHVIPGAKTEDLTRANGWPKTGNGANWERSLGGPTSNRFSELRQINRSNVGQLEEAWTYHSGDGTDNIQCNPIIVDGTMYVPTPGKHVVAVDAATGKERWRFSPGSMIGKDSRSPARRGLLLWRGMEKRRLDCCLGMARGCSR
jgi:glucose dehydrogenase